MKKSTSKLSSKTFWIMLSKCCVEGAIVGIVCGGSAFAVAVGFAIKYILSSQKATAYILLKTNK